MYDTFILYLVVRSIYDEKSTAISFGAEHRDVLLQPSSVYIPAVETAFITTLASR